MATSQVFQLSLPFSILVVIVVIITVLVLFSCLFGIINWVSGIVRDVFKATTDSVGEQRDGREKVVAHNDTDRTVGYKYTKEE